MDVFVVMAFLEQFKDHPVSPLGNELSKFDFSASASTSSRNGRPLQKHARCTGIGDNERSRVIIGHVSIANHMAKNHILALRELGATILLGSDNGRGHFSSDYFTTTEPEISKRDT
jgi:hypothetical protein